MENETRCYGVNYAKDMTLRDHFAGLALQGMLANSQQQEYFDNNIVYLAYSLADAMIEKRDKSWNNVQKNGLRHG